ncbi:MAG: type II toxin-antitoxin system RelE/ParE family toxin [Rhodospirillaceae bacterium]
MASFRLSPAAERDLEQIWLYTRQQWGQMQAERYIDMLESALAELAAAPQGAAACDHIRRGYCRRYIEHHAIYFQITAYGIAVIRILHERADAPRHI